MAIQLGRDFCCRLYLIHRDSLLLISCWIGPILDQSDDPEVQKCSTILGRCLLGSRQICLAAQQGRDLLGIMSFFKKSKQKGKKIDHFR